MNIQAVLKKLIFVVSTIAVIVAILLYRSYYPPTPKDREHWLVVFIHGSFNTGLSLLSAKNVFKDKVTGTPYAKVVNKLRKDPFFYQEQAILQRGLVEVSPSFQHPIGEYKFAAYPIISAYNLILNAVKPNQEIPHFYTFGWSGLLSKSYRLNEALRLYNILQEELAKYHARGISPKVRFIIHSHGGNLSLNLAAINEAQVLLDTHKDATEQVLKNDSTRSDDEKEALLNTVVLLKKAKNNQPTALKGQKQFDYYPKKYPLIIDELILYGSPVQPETHHFAQHSTFKKIYNFYSGQDVIQGTDFISSKYYSSDQRFDASIAKNSPQLVQAQIMVDKNITQRSPQEEASNTLPWWKRFLYGIFFSEESKDPTHKDLWFMAWSKEFTQPLFPLNPLPVAIVTPLLTEALKKTPSLRDADLNMRFSPSSLTVEVVQRNQPNVISKSSIDMNIINEIKSHLEYWRPDNLSRENTFKKMRSLITTTTSQKR